MTHSDGIETTTYFDRRPSHPSVPRDIVEMELRLAELEKESDDLLEAWLHDPTGTITMASVEASCEHYNMAQNALYHLRDLQNGNDCTCDPTGGAMCTFCYRQKQYNQFMELEKGNIT